MELVPQGHNVHDWGIEVIWSNNESYCGRILMFEQANKKTPMMLHKEKKKSWFVNSGKFKITFIDVTKGTTNEAIIDEGKTVDIAEMSPHQLESLASNSVIFETGNPLYKQDNFRLTPDDAQKSSEEPK